MRKLASSSGVSSMIGLTPLIPAKGFSVIRQARNFDIGEIPENLKFDRPYCKRDAE